MTDPRNHFERKRTPLDDQLDDALAKYAAVEPRTGLEARILANLRTHENSSVGVNRWHWAVTLAAALLVVSFLIWRVERYRPEPLVHHRENSPPQTQIRIATKDTERNTLPKVVSKSPFRHARKGTSTAHVVVEKQPKLDQFPSPRPLTEQEKLLAEYVAQFQEEAVVVARARAEVLRRDMEEMDRGNR
jgi:hypothetical protein